MLTIRVDKGVYFECIYLVGQNGLATLGGYRATAGEAGRTFALDLGGAIRVTAHTTVDRDTACQPA